MAATKVLADDGASDTASNAASSKGAAIDNRQKQLEERLAHRIDEELTRSEKIESCKTPSCERERGRDGWMMGNEPATICLDCY